MKKIKLSGREAAIIRAIGFGLGMKGIELVERTNLPAEEVADILHGLMQAGFVESTPMMEQIAPGDFAETNFEVNPSYVAELKAAVQRG